VGAFAAVFASLGKIYQFMQEVICSHLGNIAQNLGTIQNFVNFLKMEERMQKTQNAAEVPDYTDYTDYKDIIVKNASFTYPNAEKQALCNINITVKNGETVAIVGENGSGKSTLVRLLTGLYIPGEGDVYFGGANLKDIGYAHVFSQTSAVFQKYRCYQMTLGENITISQFDKSRSDYNLDIIREMAGVSIETSETSGYDTMLSREFGGIDLSGGEWQRIAIARGLYRTHSFIVLDEPTAAIDPFEETKIYNRFAEISKNNTAVIVTHRLGSVRLADRIIVLKNGGIAETGTHEELLAANGEYKKMYIAQRKWYDDIHIAF
jgi:ATP-binding cassette subfamily B protein